MQTRKPIVAGQFYPGGKESCLAEVDKCLAGELDASELPDTIAGGIVPHAGWVFSGPAAGLVFSAVGRKNDEVDTFIIFGASHGYYGREAAVYDTGSWESPLGEIPVDEELADKVIATGKGVSNSNAHGTEHSIEVQVPFVQRLFPDAAILPVIVPPVTEAIELGEAVGDIINEVEKKVVFIGSTDLTHYGPRYGFTPMGVGQEAVKWASEVNDKRFIDAALRLDAEKLLIESAEHQNACGPGAAAATIAAVKKQGREKGKLLMHTNSNEMMKEKMGTTGSDSVGYAAIVF